MLLLQAAPAWSLPDDREKPIRITADQAMRDEKQGFTVYSGNVRMDQGSLHIEADKITIFRIVEEADKIVAEGVPARLRQQPNIEEGPVHARAEVIEYYKDEDRVHLKRDARIEREGSIVSGQTIEYFIAEERVRADSDSSETNRQVEVIIPAAAMQPKEAGNGASDGQ
jgi:lipopolysaccharide export system protein LptA